MKPFCAVRMSLAGSALISCTLLGASHASAQHFVSAQTMTFKGPATYDLRSSNRYLGLHLHRVVRHGVYYYVPRPLPSVQPRDDFDEAEYDEDEFDSADLDADGYLSFREARRANPQWAREFRRIDSSGDGYLTREEIEEFYRR